MVADEPTFTIALPRGFLPPEAHQALAREAVRRGVPFNQLMREALIAKASQINGAAQTFDSGERKEVAA